MQKKIIKDPELLMLIEECRILKEKISEGKKVFSESKDYFKGSHFGDEEGNEYSVEDVYEFVKKNKKK